MNENAEIWDVLDEIGNKTGRFCERGPMRQGDYQGFVMLEAGPFFLSFFS